MSWLIFITITAFLSTAVIIVVVVIVVVLICVLGGWFYYAYTHPTTPSGRWLIEVYDLYELFNSQAITVQVMSSWLNNLLTILRGRLSHLSDKPALVNILCQ